MSGASVRDAAGVYGTRGVAAESNTPGARTEAVGWASSAAGAGWVFGGYGRFPLGTGACACVRECERMRERVHVC